MDERVGKNRGRGYVTLDLLIIVFVALVYISSLECLLSIVGWYVKCVCFFTG